MRGRVPEAGRLLPSGRSWRGEWRPGSLRLADSGRSCIWRRTSSGERDVSTKASRESRDDPWSLSSSSSSATTSLCFPVVLPTPPPPPPLGPDAASASGGRCDRPAASEIECGARVDRGDEDEEDAEGPAAEKAEVRCWEGEGEGDGDRPAGALASPSSQPLSDRTSEAARQSLVSGSARSASISRRVRSRLVA